MFEMRTCYVNFAEHLQNAWNVNFLYEGAEGEWSKEDWRRFFRQIKAFGFTDFQCWIPPTLCKKGAESFLPSGKKLGNFSEFFRGKCAFLMDKRQENCYNRRTKPRLY